MRVDLSNTQPIDEEDPQVKAWLTHLQGNILRGHGRHHAVHIFFAFRGGREEVRRTLRDVAGTYVTSALKQYDERVGFRRDGIPAGRFGSLLLTARGCEKLGITNLATRFAEPPGHPNRPDPTASFLDGMKHPSAAGDFNDPPVEDWEPCFQPEIHGMLLLAHTNAAMLATEAGHALARLEPACVKLTAEAGEVVLRNDQGIEHFGFVDGRSQPLYLKTDFDDPSDRNRREPTEHWHPFEPLRRVLVHDPLVDDGLCLGSFLVFRKLEQRVRDFRTALNQLATTLGLPPEDAGRAGAFVVGRFEDGTPVFESDRPLGTATNDFVYRNLPGQHGPEDRRGRRCPLQSHIRKANPRGQSVRLILGETEEVERMRRITRRSITYGRHVSVSEPIERLPNEGVGVHFMCYQASVRQQFAFMQQHWCNAASFPQGGVGTDPLVGQGSPEHHKWPEVWGQDDTVHTPFERFVTLKGGEFFFAPSLPFFASL